MQKEIVFKNFYNKILNNFLKKGVDKFNCDYLFCEVLNISYTNLLLKNKDSAHPFYISIKDAKKIRIYHKKILIGYPVTKVLKYAYFYGEKFFVNKNVLSPRNETELLVEKTLEITNPNFKCLDLCCGSGAIGLIVKKLTNCEVFLSDVSCKALKVAKYNAKQLNLKAQFIKSNMFKNINQSLKFDIIVSNPPYIATQQIKFLDTNVKKHDPKISLDGKKDGLHFYKIIASDAKKFLKKDGTLLLEIGYNQKEDVVNILSKYFNNIECFKDYGGNDRIIIAK